MTSNSPPDASPSQSEMLKSRTLGDTIADLLQARWDQSGRISRLGRSIPISSEDLRHITSALRASQSPSPRPGAGKRILDGLKDALEGNFARVTIEGQTWQRVDPTSPAPGVKEMVERLRKPVMLHSNAEQTNAERKEAADMIERLAAQVVVMLDKA